MGKGTAKSRGYGGALCHLDVLFVASLAQGREGRGKGNEKRKGKERKNRSSNFLEKEYVNYII
jgi:hypothetical protein